MPPASLAPHSNNSAYLSSSQGRGVIAVVIDKGQSSQEGAESSTQQPLLNGHQDTHQQRPARETNGRAGGPPPPPPEEPTVDVTTEEEGRGQSLQNMLSSIVYSLGLSEAEELQYLTHWHNRTIVPTLDSSMLVCEEARWRTLYQQEQDTFEEENKKRVIISTPSPPPQLTEGRSLRSGRTLPDPTAPLESIVVSGESDAEGEESEEEEEDTWMDDASTASSDISDWTREEGISFILPVSRHRRLRKRKKPGGSRSSQESNEDIEEEEEEMEDEQEKEEDTGENARPGKHHRAAAEKGEKQRKSRRPRKPPVKSPLDYTAYHPPEWLNCTTPHSSPYFPQVGDVVVYFHQGHQLYIDAVKEEKPYPWKAQKMPWQRYRLLPQEFCQVTNVHYLVGPPTMCSITLAVLTPSSPSPEVPTTSKCPERISFTFKYHDMDGVLDFLVLDSVYKKSIRRQWSTGDRFRSMIDSMYWYGTVLGQEPFNAAFPSSCWQCHRVKWDDGATDQLSPWDMQRAEEEDGEGEAVEEQSAADWGGEGEVDRILQGVEKVAQLDEAAMFVEPVDLEEIPDYCTVVPFPTDLSTIKTRLQNRFYRRKIALLWEVVQIGRNAELYNEVASLIVKHARVLVHTLCRFITSPHITDPMQSYQEEPEEQLESEVVPVPEVEFMDDVILPLPLPSLTIPSSPSHKAETTSKEEGKEIRLSTTWYCHAEQVLRKMREDRNAFPFLEPVDTTLYPDYPDVIPHPTDLSTIGKNLENHHYLTPHDFISDIRLMLNNAKTYNSKGSQVYKMTVELQTLFDDLVLGFLKSCTGEGEEPMHATRRTLGRLAHSTTSEEALMTGNHSVSQARPLRPRRRHPPVARESESGSDTERSSVGVSTPLSESSSVFTVQAMKTAWKEARRSERRRENSLGQSHGMTLRSRERPVKRALEESESEEEEEEQEQQEEEEEEEEEEETKMSPRRTRSWSNPHKRQRLSSDSEEEEGLELPSVITRTSRGRVVKPTSKFS